MSEKSEKKELNSKALEKLRLSERDQMKKEIDSGKRDVGTIHDIEKDKTHHIIDNKPIQ